MSIRTLAVDNSGTDINIKYRIRVEEDLYVDAMFATSRTPLPPLVSMQGKGRNLPGC